MTLSNEEIAEYLNELDSELKAIKKDLLTLCWFMRGSLTYDDAMMTSFQDREIISEIIKANLETTKDSGLPFF